MQNILYIFHSMEKSRLSKGSTDNDFEQCCMTEGMERLCQALPAPLLSSEDRVTLERNLPNQLPLCKQFLFHYAFQKSYSIPEDELLCELCAAGAIVYCMLSKLSSVCQMFLTNLRVILTTLHFLPPNLSEYHVTPIFVTLLNLILPSQTALSFFVSTHITFMIQCIQSK